MPEANHAASKLEEKLKASQKAHEEYVHRTELENGQLFKQCRELKKVAERAEHDLAIAEDKIRQCEVGARQAAIVRKVLFEKVTADMSKDEINQLKQELSRFAEAAAFPEAEDTA